METETKCDARFVVEVSQVDRDIYYMELSIDLSSEMNDEELQTYVGGAIMKLVEFYNEKFGESIRVPGLQGEDKDED